MNSTLRKDADAIIASSLNAVLPDEAVRRALKAFAPKGGRVLLVAAGKAAWQMAHAAVEALGRVDGSVVVTKYKHVRGEILGVNCYEAGHPVPDENSFAATEKALELVRGLAAEDTVLFLLSGGGSALFEKPLLPGTELQDITGQLLASGADIVEMNTIRKRLSGVKGGRLAFLSAALIRLGMKIRPADDTDFKALTNMPVASTVSASNDMGTIAVSADW